MVSKGVPQLKSIRLYFCDFGGSSLGVRQALKETHLVSFMKENPHLKLELYMRRNHHPYMSSTYINGYNKEQSLRNFTQTEVVEWLKKVNNEYGRRPLRHNSAKVQTERHSIQGVWNDTMWNQYPKHMMDTMKRIEGTTIDLLPLRPKMEKRVRPHRQTVIARKKYPLRGIDKL